MKNPPNAVSPDPGATSLLLEEVPDDVLADDAGDVQHDVGQHMLHLGGKKGGGGERMVGDAVYTREWVA